ncbi:transposase [Kushneria sinocarnis]|uniref:transposase n=1 Tax=Kushneria sinocarnis TaxID=595502 RepID=UPI003CCC491D
MSLPKVWTQDRERCRRAGIPDEVGFASEPELARRMLERAFDHNMPVARVAEDSLWRQPSWLLFSGRKPCQEAEPGGLPMVQCAGE